MLLELSARSSSLAKSETKSTPSFSVSESFSESSGTSSSDSSQLLHKTKTFALHLCAFLFKHSTPSIAVPLFFVQIVQALTFALDEDFGWGGEQSQGIEIFLECLRFLRTASWETDLYSTTRIFLYIFSVLQLLFWIGLWLVFRNFQKDFSSEGRAIFFLRLFAEVFRLVLFLPTLHVALAMLICTPGLSPTGRSDSCGSSVVVWETVLAALCIVSSVLITGASTLCQFEWLRTSKHPFAAMNYLGAFGYFVGGCTLTLVTHFLRHPRVPVRVRYYTVSSVVCIWAAAELWGLLAKWPFYKWWANVLKYSMWSIVLLSGILGIVQTALPSHSRTIFWIFWGLVLPAGATAAIGSHLWHAKIAHRRLKLGQYPDFFRPHPVSSTDSEGSSSSGEGASDEGGSVRSRMTVATVEDLFDSPSDVAYFFSHLAFTKGERTRAQEELIDQYAQILSGAITLFPQNPMVEAYYCAYIIDTSEELAPLIVHLRHVASLPLWFPDAALFVRIDEQRRELLQKYDGGSEEIEQAFKQASKYHQRAKQALRDFWHVLVTRKELTSITEVVAELDKAEQGATTIFEHLRTKFPQSPKVLRQYAVFVEDVKRDTDLARAMLDTADVLEENSTKKGVREGKPRARAEISGVDDEDYQSSLHLISHHAGVKFKSDTQLRHPEDEEDEFAWGSDSQSVMTATTKRHNWFRQRVSEMKSTTFEQLLLTVLLVIGLVLINCTITFNIVNAGFEKLKSSFLLMQNASDSRAVVPNSNVNALHMLLAMRHNNTAEFNLSQSRILANSRWFQPITKALILNSRGSHLLRERWYNNNMTGIIWASGTGTRIGITFDLEEMCECFGHSSSVLGLMPRPTSERALARRFDFRFILDNSPTELRQALRDLAEDYVSDVRRVIRDNSAIIAALLPCTMVLVIGLMAALFVRSLRLIKSERQDVLRLFLAIPPKTTADIFRLCGGTLSNTEANAISDGDTHDQNERELRNLKMKFTRELAIRFSLGVSVLIILAVSMCAFGLFCMSSFRDPVVLTFNRGGEKTLLRRMHVMAAAIILNDTLTFPGGYPQMLAYYQETRDLYQSLEDSSQLPQFQSLERAIPGLGELIYEKDCSSLIGTKCNGLYEMTSIYLDYVTDFMNTPPGLLSTNSPSWQAICDIDFNHLFDWHREKEALILNHFLDKLRFYSLVISLLFAVSWPCSILLYLFVHTPLQRIRLEHNHTVKMFLLIPAESIDAIPEIRTFLETGTHRLKEAETRMRGLNDSLSQTEKILMASSDAVITFDQAGIITLYNKSAETLFGTTMPKALGQNVGKFLPQEYLKMPLDPKKLGEELVVRNAVGEEFVVAISRSRTVVNGKEINAVFIRDLRGVKAYKRLIRENEALLCKILPKTLAHKYRSALLATSNASLSSELARNALGLESHPKVTILFADIIKFAEWAGTTDPNNLLKVLNEIIGAWDRLAIARGVEKIKTIGDCYMCAAGAPDPKPDQAFHVVFLGVEMLAALRELNVILGTDMHLRIGVNTGSVVAGIIGLTKIIYDLWGPAVNLAKRMETTGFADSIQVSEATYQEVKQKFEWDCRGEVEIRSGSSAKTKAWVYTPKRSELDDAAHKVRSEVSFGSITKRTSNISREPSAVTTFSIKI